MLFIDADSAVYSVCFGCKDLSLGSTLDVMDLKLRTIIQKFPDHPYVIVISSRAPTFRAEIAKTVPYKGHRKAEKPQFYEEMRQHLLDKWKAFETVDGLEADDFIGIHCTNKDILASIDKDMLMINAKGHYNFNRDTLKKVKRNLYFFFYQLLVGDKADNIVGLDGIGDKKATELLRGVKLSDMPGIVLSKYIEEFGDNARARLHENCQLLWILRHPKKGYQHYVKFPE